MCANPSMMRCSRSTATAIMLACGLLVGCGQSDDRDDVRAVAERFFTAMADEDGETACAQLSVDTRAQLESDEQRQCREAITDLRLDGGAPTRVEVFVTNAKVDLPGGQSAFLSRSREGWRLSAIGCSPQAGKPADRPYDCDLEA